MRPNLRPCVSDGHGWSSTKPELDPEAAAGVGPGDGFFGVRTDYAACSALETSRVVEAYFSFLHGVETRRACKGAGLAGAGFANLFIHLYVGAVVIDDELVDTQELFDAHLFHSHLAPFQPSIASPVRLSRFFRI